MNAGELASRRGLGGVPPEAETIVLDRDMRLVNMIRGRYHAALVSSRLSLEVIERAKAKGLPVTCGVSINHLTLNENDVGEYRTFFKFAPPLRGEEERNALVQALATGLIDVLVSDHNPQDVETKRLPFGEAENGAIGLETILSAGLRLVHAGDITLCALLRAMTSRPAEILRLPQGLLKVGAPADLMRFDADEPYVLDPTDLHSRSKNTPFERARLQGRVKLTMVGGLVVHS
jgi:dihydroorotase